VSEKLNKENDKPGSSGGGSQRRTGRRKKELKIHETKVIEIDKSTLPEDAVFKGYSEKIIKGIQINEFNTLIKRELFYSPTEKKTYLPALSGEYKMGFSAEIQVLIIELKYNFGMTESKILEFFKSYHIEISAGQISNILLKNGESHLTERDDILKAGLAANICQTDTTECKERGNSKQVHIFCNDMFSAFYTENDRKRTTIVDVLRGKQERMFCLNDEFFSILNKKQVANKHIEYFGKYKTDKDILLKEQEIINILEPYHSNKNLYSMFYEIAYIAGFHSEEGFQAASVLVTDDASVYDNISFNHALCWIHEGRHFKKLTPLLSDFQQMVDSFLKRFWDYYHTLLDFKQNPSAEYKELLEIQFEKLFNTCSPYDELNDRIKKLYAKKEQLLVVLNSPHIPLHNNGSEILARAIKRFKDVSFHTVSEVGTEVRDTFFTLIFTAKKLGIIFREYLFDKISGENLAPSLSDLIIANTIPP